MGCVGGKGKGKGGDDTRLDARVEGVVLQVGDAHAANRVAQLREERSLKGDEADGERVSE